jgi:hypothetical protein
MSQKGKQPQQKQGQQPQTKSAQPTKQTLETLVSSLLDQGFEALPNKNDIPPNDKKAKAVAALCTLLRTKLKAPKNHADLPRDAISFNLQLQMNSGLTVANSKRVLLHIFTFLIEELANWEEYGIDRADVHADVCIASLDIFIAIFAVCFSCLYLNSVSDELIHVRLLN